jgi:peroxiredoxin
MQKWTLVMAFAAALGLTACGEEVAQDVCEPGPREGYPTQNLGTTVGTSIANLTLINPDETAFQLSEVYQDAEGRRRLLLVSTAAGWCRPCREEQPALQALYERHRDRGLEIVVAYFEDHNFTRATAGHAGAWADEYSLTFPVVADPENKFKPYYPGADATVAPLNMMIDVCTMEILTSGIGFNESEINAIIQAKLPAE